MCDYVMAFNFSVWVLPRLKCVLFFDFWYDVVYCLMVFLISMFCHGCVLGL